jgi:phosphate transport system protein
MHSPMSRNFDSRLEHSRHRLVHALEQASHAICHLDETVLAPRPDAVELLAREGDRLRRDSRETDLELVTLLACHAPVAGDLRLVLTSIQVAQHVGLIANQLRLIAEQLEEVDAEAGVSPTGEGVAKMAPVACEQLSRAAVAYGRRDPELVHQLEVDDDVVDQLNRQVCQAAMALGAGLPQRALAMRHVLIARCLERIGDNAVTIAAQTALLVQADVHQLAAQLSAETSAAA